jgi:predicted DNA-binding protein
VDWYNPVLSLTEGGDVPKRLLDKLSIYVPKTRLEERPVERLIALADRKDRSVNYLVVEAILQYLKKEEKKK